MSLRRISLRDFVIVRSLELDLADGFSVPKKMATPIAPMTTPARIETMLMSRSVRSPCASPPALNARAATPNEPAITRSDLMMPKIPAVAIAPTPM